MLLQQTISAAALLMTAITTGAMPAAANAESSKAIVVKLGFASPLTGAQVHLGKDNENGAQLAVDEINAAGLVVNGRHVRLELIPEDDAADPRTGTQVAQKLVDDGVV